MPLKVHTNPAFGADLGSATCVTDSRAMRASAADPRYVNLRPIDVSITTADGHYTAISFSLDEAEALIACLTHAVALRRAAEAQEAA